MAAVTCPPPPPSPPPLVVSCRTGVHGTVDGSRAWWRSRRGREVTISERLATLAPNPDAGGARTWPLHDSFGRPLGRVLVDADGRRQLEALDGVTRFGVQVLDVRGRGCMADPRQQARHALVQVIARDADAGGLQAFVDRRALDPNTDAAVRAQRGTGCGPSGPERGRMRPLRDPDVYPFAHARLSNGVLNDVKEYDAKPSFGGAVYLMTNTTGVRVGGIVRIVVRVGTPVAKVDQLRGCDRGSDGTLTWRYVSVRTGLPARPRVFGWLPARCVVSGRQ